MGSASRSVAAAGGGDETLLGVEDPLRCVEVGAGDGVDRRPVGSPQGLRFLDAISWCGEETDRVLEHLIDEEVH